MDSDIKVGGFVMLMDKFQRFDDRFHFHAIVCRIFFIAGKLVFFAVDKKYCRPAAGAGISETRAVCVDFDLH